MPPAARAAASAGEVRVSAASSGYREREYARQPGDRAGSGCDGLHCKMGGRSARALNFLRSRGYPKLKNVAGGINAWAERIDPNVPQY